MPDTDPYPYAATPGGNVPTTAPAMPNDGTFLTPAGYGIEGGVPYGTTRRDNREAQKRRYKFAPANLARLQAATRRALGR